MRKRLQLRRTCVTALGILPFVFALTCAARDRIPLLPDTAQLHGATLDTAHTGSGDAKILTNFNSADDRAAFTFNAAGGLYEARVRYRAGGYKGFLIEVNGLTYGADMAGGGDDFVLASPVRVLLKEGQNQLSVGGGWGHYDIARIDLVPIDVPPPPKPPTGGLSDPQAGPEARALWRKLIANYGKITLSGVYDDKDVAYVRQKTGKTPNILGADLSDYSPSRIQHGANPNGIAEGLIKQWRQGLMLTLSWHWNAPTLLVDNAGKTDSLPPEKRWYMGFNTAATTFDFAAALRDEQSPEFQLLLRDIDALAVPLGKLLDAHVPVLFRPLHEAEGGWFWWGSKGPVAYVQLWRLVHDRLTHRHGLHNLIWVFTAGQDPRWYPGDDVVDIIGVDNYPKDNRDPLVANWVNVLNQFGRRKLLTLSEIGFVPDLDLARAHGVYWSYYNTWNGNLGPTNLPVDELRRRFDSPFMGWTRPN